MSVPTSPSRSARLVRFPLLLVLCGATGAFGCSSSSSSPSTTDSAFGSSGEVVGMQDMHCVGVPPIVVNPSSCAGPAASADAEAPAGDGGAAISEYGNTMYNNAGDDDDCKYSVSYTDAPTVKVNETMTFRVVVKKLADGAPETGAAGSDGGNVSIEAFLSTMGSHVLPNTPQPMKATESPAGSGIYTIAPIVFDQSGRWVVRFHLNENCADTLDDSPHGHAAFFFDVP
jgi:hypothetical protein